MLDETAFRTALHETLHSVDATSAVELHLHGGESFFLRHVNRVCESFAVCDLIPMHEWGSDTADRRRMIRPQEAAVPYATIARLVVSARRLTNGEPIGFRGANGLTPVAAAADG